jgi:hypothetical protein
MALPNRWSIHRAAVDRLRHFSAFPRLGTQRRVLILSEQEKIAHAQFFPFFYCADILQHERQTVIRELPLSAFLNGCNPYRDKIDVVCFQTFLEHYAAGGGDVGGGLHPFPGLPRRRNYGISRIPNNLANHPLLSTHWEPYFGPLTVSYYNFDTQGRRQRLGNPTVDRLGNDPTGGVH